MHSPVLLLQLFAVSAIASPLAQLMSFKTGDELVDATSYVEPPASPYQIVAGLVPDRQLAQPEVQAPVNQLAQPFVCTTEALPVPACCPQSVYLPADPNCIPYSQFYGAGCERDDGIKFRGACCYKFDRSGGIMCQDPSVTVNIPQVIYENINQQPFSNQ